MDLQDALNKLLNEEPQDPDADVTASWSLVPFGRQPNQPPSEEAPPSVKAASRP